MLRLEAVAAVQKVHAETTGKVVRENLYSPHPIPSLGFALMA